MALFVLDPLVIASAVPAYLKQCYLQHRDPVAPYNGCQSPLLRMPA